MKRSNILLILVICAVVLVALSANEWRIRDQKISEQSVRIAELTQSNNLIVEQAASAQATSEALSAEVARQAQENEHLRTLLATSEWQKELLSPTNCYGFTSDFDPPQITTMEGMVYEGRSRGLSGVTFTSIEGNVGVQVSDGAMSGIAVVENGIYNLRTTFIRVDVSCNVDFNTTIFTFLAVEVEATSESECYDCTPLDKPQQNA